MLNYCENVLKFPFSILVRASFAVEFKPQILAKQLPNQYFSKDRDSLITTLFLSRNACMDTFMCGGFWCAAISFSQKSVTLVYFHKGKGKIILVMISRCFFWWTTKRQKLSWNTHFKRTHFSSQIGDVFLRVCVWLATGHDESWPIRILCVLLTRTKARPYVRATSGSFVVTVAVPAPDIPSASVVYIKLAHLSGRLRALIFLVDAQILRQEDEGARSRYGHCRITDLSRLPKWLLSRREEERPQSDGQGRR